MIIKPDNISFKDEYDEFIDDEKYVEKDKRDFYIHDLKLSPFSDGLSYGLVTQVTKLLTSHLPNNDDGYKIIFNKPIENRKSFIKIIYMYNITLRNDIPIEEAFMEAVLKPRYAIITGMTDTERVYDMFVKDTVRYLMTLYNFNEKHIMRMYDTNRVDHIIGDFYTFEFDIPDPRSNGVRMITFNNKIDNFHKCYSIPSSFKGHELFRAHSNIHIYKDIHSNMHENNINETSVCDITKNLHLSKSDDPIIAKYSKEILNQNIYLKNLLVDMVKVSIKTMFGEFTLIYDTIEGHTIKRIVTPFTTPNLKVFEEYMLNVEVDFLQHCERIVERFGDVRIMLHVNDVEHVVSCIFKESKSQKTLKIRMNKQECISDYLFEITNISQRNEFMQNHDLDKLDYMYLNKDDNRVFINFK